MSARQTWLLAPMLLVAACAAIPKPSLLETLDHVREGAVATEARHHAPDALARAEKLRGEAEAAFAHGDLAGAQLLAERALAAYTRAGAVARTVRAETTTSNAKTSLATAQTELSGLEAELARVGADADALELRLKVIRDAQPIQPSGKASPERERARLSAARSLAMDARLLCSGARLLVAAPDAKHLPSLDEAEAALGTLESDLAAAVIPAAPIDRASRVRAGCLSALTALRRAAAPASRATGVGDALLAELSATGLWAPSRDDRGVSLVLRGVFAGSAAALTPQGKAWLAELGKVAAVHPSFPLEVVLHTDRPVGPRDEAAMKARAETAVKALQKAGGSAVRAMGLVAGNQTPVVDPAGPERARNARLEVVFVTPHGF